MASEYWQDNLYDKFIPAGWKDQDEEEHLKCFVTVLAYVLDQIQDYVDTFDTTWKIDTMPIEYFPFLAERLGFDLLGTDTDAVQRNQLKNAVSIYNQLGGLTSIQTFFSNLNLSISAQVLWTNNYEDFYLEGNTQVGTPVWEGEDAGEDVVDKWYPTSHFSLVVSGDLGDEANAIMVRDAALARASLIVPINVVLEGFGVVVRRDGNINGIAQSPELTRGNAHSEGLRRSGFHLVSSS